MDHHTAGGRDGSDGFAARQPGGDDIFHQQHLLPWLQPEPATQFERAGWPFDEH